MLFVNMYTKATNRTFSANVVGLGKDKHGKVLAITDQHLSLDPVMDIQLPTASPEESISDFSTTRIESMHFHKLMVVGVTNGLGPKDVSLRVETREIETFGVFRFDDKHLEDHPNYLHKVTDDHIAEGLAYSMILGPGKIWSNQDYNGFLMYLNLDTLLAYNEDGELLLDEPTLQARLSINAWPAIIDKNPVLLRGDKTTRALVGPRLALAESWIGFEGLNI